MEHPIITCTRSRTAEPCKEVRTAAGLLLFLWSSYSPCVTAKKMVYQNATFSANCKTRGAKAVCIRPKFGFASEFTGALKFA